MSAVELLKNPRLEEWSGGFPTIWSRIATVAVTYRQLLRTDSLDHPQRRVFESFASLTPSERDYIHSGGVAGCRLGFSAAAAANGWIIRQEAAAAAGVPVVAGQRLSPLVIARNSVENNLLRMQVIGILNVTDVLFLVPDPEAVDDTDGHIYPGRGGFQWSTVETNIVMKMKSLWTTFSMPFVVPLGIDSVSVRLSNGSAGAQVIDLGMVSLSEISQKIGGAA